jgi:hypothetical protein
LTVLAAPPPHSAGCCSCASRCSHISIGLIAEFVCAAGVQNDTYCTCKQSPLKLILTQGALIETIETPICGHCKLPTHPAPGTDAVTVTARTSAVGAGVLTSLSTARQAQPCGLELTAAVGVDGRAFRVRSRVKVLWETPQWKGWHHGHVIKAEGTQYEVRYDDGSWDSHPASSITKVRREPKMSRKAFEAERLTGGCAFVSRKRVRAEGAAVATGTLRETRVGRTCLPDSLWSALKTAGVTVELKDVRAALPSEFRDPSVPEAMRYAQTLGMQLEIRRRLTGSVVKLFRMTKGSFLVRLELKDNTGSFFHFVAFDAAAGLVLDNDLTLIPRIEACDRLDNRSAIATLSLIYPHVAEVRIRDVFEVLNHVGQATKVTQVTTDDPL